MMLWLRKRYLTTQDIFLIPTEYQPNGSRASVETTFAMLKENLGLNSVTVRGIKKTKVHILLICIASIAGTLAVNISKDSDKAA